MGAYITTHPQPHPDARPVRLLDIREMLGSDATDEDADRAYDRLRDAGHLTRHDGRWWLHCTEEEWEAVAADIL
jgi:hypothetical protein